MLQIPVNSSRVSAVQLTGARAWEMDSSAMWQALLAVAPASTCSRVFPADPHPCSLMHFITQIPAWQLGALLEGS